MKNLTQTYHFISRPDAQVSDMDMRQVTCAATTIRNGAT